MKTINKAHVDGDSSIMANRLHLKKHTKSIYQFLLGNYANF